MCCEGAGEVGEGVVVAGDGGRVLTRLCYRNGAAKIFHTRPNDVFGLQKVYTYVVPINVLTTFSFFFQQMIDMKHQILYFLKNNKTVKSESLMFGGTFSLRLIYVWTILLLLFAA